MGKSSGWRCTAVPKLERCYQTLSWNNWVRSCYVAAMTMVAITETVLRHVGAPEAPRRVDPPVQHVCDLLAGLARANQSKGHVSTTINLMHTNIRVLCWVLFRG